MAEILLVEDDQTLGMTVRMTLAASGHSVRLARTLAEAREGIETAMPELLILDLGLPDGDGLDLCRELREAGQRVAILILTARGTLQARVEGLTSGGDDYLTKPFELPELLARIQALLRRQGWQAETPPSDDGEVIEVGELVLDPRTLEGRRGDEQFMLTELEVRLLRYLLDRAGEVVPREDLLKDVWNLSPTTRTRTVDVFISRLRRYIEPDGERPRHLLGVRGVGYRLVV